MDSYGVVISDEMLRNATQTDAETLDLMTWKLLAYFFFLGCFRASSLQEFPLRWNGWQSELKRRAGFIGILVVLIAAVLMAFSGFYASFIREHKPLRTYANPAYFIYSAVRVRQPGRVPAESSQTLTAVGTDAQIPV